jgi:hypothetical protein
VVAESSIVTHFQTTWSLKTSFIASFLCHVLAPYWLAARSYVHPITSIPLLCSSNHEQPAPMFIQPRAARSSVHPITSSPLLCSSNHEQPAPLFIQSRAARFSVHPVTSSPLLCPSNHEQPAPLFIQSRAARSSVHPITPSSPTHRPVPDLFLRFPIRTKTLTLKMATATFVETLGNRQYSTRLIPESRSYTPKCNR